MTLKAFLETLRADPLDASSPHLIVAEGNLSPPQREQVISSAYGRHPYAVIVTLSRGLGRALHNGTVLTTGAVEVHLHHPVSSARVEPDGEVITRLQAAVLDARSVVTEVRDGYALVGRLALASEVDPHPQTMNNLDGLRAVTRFTYRLWR